MSNYYVSNCCGTPMDAIYEDVEICPTCGEHCALEAVIDND